MTLPYRPHIGTLSTSPELDSINSLTPDNHGGNMDLPGHGPGEHHLPPGAHAGCPSVHRRRPRLPGRRRGLRHGGGVRQRDDDPRRADQGLDDRLAPAGERGRHHGDRSRPVRWRTPPASPTASSIYWMERDYGFDRWDAYMMLSQCGQVRLGNFVDPKYTVGAAIRKTLPRKEAEHGSGAGRPERRRHRWHQGHRPGDRRHARRRGGERRHLRP